MTIDRSGEWWTGSDPGDLEEYLEAFTAEEYPIEQFRLARCGCGSFAFRLDANPNEGAALRQCLSCSSRQYICDSQEYWEDVEPESWECIECGTDQTNVGVGFSLYDDGNDIRWLYVGVRCLQCGILGCFAGWKIGYGPSLHLINHV